MAASTTIDTVRNGFKSLMHQAVSSGIDLNTAMQVARDACLEANTEIAAAQLGVNDEKTVNGQFVYVEHQRSSTFTEVKKRILLTPTNELHLYLHSSACAKKPWTQSDFLPEPQTDSDQPLKRAATAALSEAPAPKRQKLNVLVKLSEELDEFRLWVIPDTDMPESELKELRRGIHVQDSDCEDDELKEGEVPNRKRLKELQKKIKHRMVMLDGNGSVTEPVEGVRVIVGTDYDSR
jgi:hypothetical protein